MRRRRRKPRPGAEVNVTSLVDLAFTLLIVFVIVTPVMVAGVDLELPETEARALEAPEERLEVEVLASGEIRLDEAYGLEPDTLMEEVFRLTDGGHHWPVYVYADGDAPYRVVAQVLGALQGSGFQRLNLVTRARSGR